MKNFNFSMHLTSLNLLTLIIADNQTAVNCDMQQCHARRKKQIIYLKLI